MLRSACSMMSRKSYAQLSHAGICKRRGQPAKPAELPLTRGVSYHDEREPAPDDAEQLSC